MDKANIMSFLLQNDSGHNLRDIDIREGGVKPQSFSGFMGMPAYHVTYDSYAYTARLFSLYNQISNFSYPRFWNMGVRGFPVWLYKSREFSREGAYL